jgi:glucose/arabinose dehydrogenase
MTATFRRETMRRFLMMMVLSAVLALGYAAPAAGLPLDELTLPEGFEIAVYADDVPSARSLARSPNGTIFVSTRALKVVYAVVDTDGDHVADKTYVVADELNSPNGVAFKDGALYVAEISRVLRFDDIENNLESPPEPVVLIDTLPTEEHHGWKYLAFGPDGKLYFNVGAPCNICNMEEQDERFATIMRMNADGSEPEVYARGVRNSVGFTWHPATDHLWFTDNGRDLMGDDVPPDELNRATEQDQHFGYPYCHGGEIPDPEFAADRTCDEFVPPVQKMDAHVAALGLKFYTGEMFPEAYRNQIIIAEHGSWNRSIPIGYRLMLVKLDDEGNSLGKEPFIEGWLQRSRAWGRPVDVLVQPDGSLLVSDDKAGVVYRVTYTGEG